MPYYWWWPDGFLEWFLMLAIVASMLVLVGIVGFGLFVFSDSVGIQDECAEGTIVSQTYHPAYTSFVLMGKIMVPQFHPESWTITARVSEHTISSTFRRECPCVGKRAKVKYYVGRFSDSWYLNGYTCTY